MNEMNEMMAEGYDPKMLSTGECELPGYFKIDCRMNILNMYASKKIIYLSESQKRLMICLINNIHCKRMIIKIVWHECHQRIRDNNYHQLVYQLRNTFSKNELPSDLLVTIPHRGLVLNKDALNKPAARDGQTDERGMQSFSTSRVSSLMSFMRSVKRAFHFA